VANNANKTVEKLKLKKRVRKITNLSAIETTFSGVKTTLLADNKSCVNCSTTQKPKLKKGVQFHCSAKTWDGPREEHCLLERLALEFWQARPSTAVLDELVNDVNESMLLKLRDFMVDVIERVNQNFENSKGAQLIPGGGKRGIRLKACHVPHAKLLLCKINKAFLKVIGTSLGRLHEIK